jgi:hypothetical protein
MADGRRARDPGQGDALPAEEPSGRHRRTVAHRTRSGNTHGPDSLSCGPARQVGRERSDLPSSSDLKPLRGGDDTYLWRRATDGLVVRADGTTMSFLLASAAIYVVGEREHAGID